MMVPLNQNSFFENLKVPIRMLNLLGYIVHCCHIMQVASDFEIFPTDHLTLYYFLYTCSPPVSQVMMHQ